MLARIMPAIISGNRESLNEIARMDDAVDILQAQIIEYMGKISKGALTDGQTSEFLRLMEAVNDLENIGDTIETNLVALGHERISQGVSISKPTQEVLLGFHRSVAKSVADEVPGGGAVERQAWH